MEVTKETIECWKINYALDKGPHELHDFWESGAPPGAVLALKAAVMEIERLQAKVDSLMLEFCPNEMTKSQVEEWAQHQSVIDAAEMALSSLASDAGRRWHE